MGVQPGDKVDRLEPIDPDWPEFGDEEFEDGSKKKVRLVDAEDLLPLNRLRNVRVDHPRFGLYRPWRDIGL
jgi:hypothetical protein